MSSSAQTGSSGAATHCPYCALQCGMRLVGEGDAIAVAAHDFPTNKGGLCQKGWNAAQLLRRADRLTSPLMRAQRGARLHAVSWNEALTRIAQEFIQVQELYGRDAVGVLGGGGLINEKAYLLGKLARVALGTSSIDYNGRFCMSSAAAAGLKAFGLDRGLPFPLEDIPQADVILLVGANPAETMPPVMQYFEAQRRRGGRLIVVDPRASPTARSADLHLQLTPGTDAALANGLLHLAVGRGWVDQVFIAHRTAGYEAVRRVIASYWPERVERLCGIPVAQLREAAALIGGAANLMVLTARGAEQQSRGVDNVLAFINLTLALGQAGKPYSGYGCLTGQGNGQGGREHGQKADQLPGYRRIDNEADREHIAKVWGVAAASLPGPGRSAYEMLDRIGGDGGVRALLVMGSNPVVSAPNARHIQRKLAALDFLAVTDFFLSETAAQADVVLPSLQWAEEDGTMTNLEGRVLLRRKVLAPPPGVRSELSIIAELAALLGCPSGFAEDPRAVFEELRAASKSGPADYSGISYERIEREDGVFWPCRSEAAAGETRLFLERFATPDGRARFHPVEHQPAAEEPDEEYPLFLTTGRVLAHYQSGTQTRRTTALNAAQPGPFVEIHPATAQSLGIANDDLVQLTTRRGAAWMKARLTSTIRFDTVFAPFHWSGDGSVNRLTNPALDPVSRMPEFKICAVRVEKSVESAAAVPPSNEIEGSRE